MSHIVPCIRHSGQAFSATKLERDWNEKMEQINEKYNLDYYSSSESDSESES